MALVVKDRVRESSSSTGTGTFVLSGAVSGFQSFSVIGDGNTTYYAIVDSTNGVWEVGIGTYTASGTTLSRDTILESSNSGNAVDFAAGVKDVFCTYPAERSVDTELTQTLNNKTLASPTITGNATINAQGDLRFADADSSNYVAFQAPATITTNVLWTLPAADGSANQVLKTNGSGNLGWVTPNAGTVTSVDVSGGTTGLTTSGGPVTGSGTITLAGTLGVANGGTGATTLTGVVKGNGTSAFTASNVNLASEVTGTLPVANGGTGQTSYTDGQLLIGNSTSGTLSKSTLTQGTGVTITNGNGSITVANSSPMTYPGAGIPNSTGSAWGTSYSTSGTGTVVALTASPVFTTPNLGTPSAATLTNATGLPLSTGVTGQLPLANGGTGANLTDPNADRILFWDDSAGAVTWLEAGSGLSISGTTISATDGTVTSVALSGGTTGLTVSGSPITTSGTITLAGTLNVANGGTGATTLTGLILGNGTSAFTTVTAPSGTVVGTTDTQTLTNKRVNPRVSSTASISSPLAWNSDNFDMYAATAQAGALTINADSGTPVNGQKIIFRFKDNGTARALTWTTGSSKSFQAVGITLPTTTVINKTTYVGCIYNAADDRWDAVATVTQA